MAINPTTITYGGKLIASIGAGQTARLTTDGDKALHDIIVKAGGGVTFIPSMDEEGSLSWQNNGNLPNPATVKIKGEDGKTPVKGVDYYTENEKSEFSQYIASEIARRGQLAPEFAESLEWLEVNGDHSKMYVLPDGFIYAYMLTSGESKPLFTNLLEISIDTDGTPYEGGKGYKPGYRINSSKVEEVAEGNCITGYIPMPGGAKGQTLRFKNMPKGTKSVYILYYKSDFTAGDSITYESAIYASPDEDGVYSVTLATNDYTAYIRLTSGDMSETIITIDEEIKWSPGGTGNRWESTKHAFVPADYEDRIIGLEDAMERHGGRLDTLEELTSENAAAIEQLWAGGTNGGNSNNEISYESANSIDECKDTTKRYLLPDGYIYAYRATGPSVKPLFTNLLSTAIDTNGASYNGGKGYKEGYRISSGGIETEVDGCCMTGYIPCNTPGATLRFKNMPQSPEGDYVHYYHEDFTRGDAITYESSMYASPDKNGVYSVTLSSAAYARYIRITAGQMSENTIITINEEISYEEVPGGYAWVNTGLTSDTATVEGRLSLLEDGVALIEANVTEIEGRLENIEKGITNLTEAEQLELIRQWDAPIYDRTPVWEITTEKEAITSSERTVASVYAKYDALMAEHPDFITRTDLGLCSDGVTHIYRYDFRERESRHQSGFEWSETKPKIIVVTGIHREWNGIYGMFHALSEITTNSELAELRRSVHFIVVPVLNPYSISGPYATVGHAANANGVEIHRNFEVGFSVQNEGTFQYSGATPLSEVESQYLDNILKNNTDAAYFLTCHSFDRDKTWGVGFLWGSSATKYMCNMAFRVIDKMGKAWHKKYGKTWEDGIKAQNEYLLANIATYPKATAIADGDYRIGHAALTNTGGCEQRQATKYGIQATNFEVGETFFVLDETMLSAKAITHGAEAYVNFFLTAMGVYDYKDKKEYAAN